MSDGRPLFAFAFRSGEWRAPSTLAEVDAAAEGTDFIWVHLNLADTAAQAWLHRRPWPPDVVEMIAAPVQRGKLFITRERLYGHLRDFREGTDVTGLQAGSLSIAATEKLLVTGRRIPLRSVEELRRRVEAQTIAPSNPFGLITEFFRALNDIGEGLLQEAGERLRVLEAKVLKRERAGLSEGVLEIRPYAARGIARFMPNAGLCRANLSDGTLIVSSQRGISIGVVGIEVYGVLKQFHSLIVVFTRLLRENLPSA
jgi:Mg2+ and Co2+ transporter CorA